MFQAYLHPITKNAILILHSSETELYVTECSGSVEASPRRIGQIPLNSLKKIFGLGIDKVKNLPLKQDFVL